MKYIGFFLVILLFVSCEKEETFEQIVGKWNFTGVEGYKSFTALPDDLSATITFFSDDKRVEIASTCNSAGGSVSISGNEINFDEIYITEMYCNATANDWENKLISGLMNAETFEITENKLRIFSNSSTNLVFEKD